MKIITLLLISFNLYAQSASSTSSSSTVPIDPSATTTPVVIAPMPDPVVVIDPAIEAARLAEIARKKDIRSRLKALSASGDIRMHMHKCGYNIPNMAIFKKKLMKKKNLLKLECLESKDVAVKALESTEKTHRTRTKRDKKLARKFLKGAQCGVLTSKELCAVMVMFGADANGQL